MNGETCTIKELRSLNESYSHVHRIILLKGKISDYLNYSPITTTMAKIQGLYNIYCYTSTQYYNKSGVSTLSTLYTGISFFIWRLLGATQLVLAEYIYSTQNLHICQCSSLNSRELRSVQITILINGYTSFTFLLKYLTAL